MHRVLWTPAAAADLEGIATYLHPRTPLHSTRIVREIYRAARSLSHQPNRGRLGRLQGTRELVLRNLPFLVIYKIDPTEVHILRILHGAMDRSDL